MCIHRLTASIINGKTEGRKGPITITTSDILVAILNEDQSMKEALRSLNIDEVELRSNLQKSTIIEGKGLASWLYSVPLEAAFTLVRSKGGDINLSPYMILYGLTCELNGIAGKVLREMGLSADEVFRKL